MVRTNRQIKLEQNQVKVCHFSSTVEDSSCASLNLNLFYQSTCLHTFHVTFSFTWIRYGYFFIMWCQAWNRPPNAISSQGYWGRLKGFLAFSSWRVWFCLVLCTHHVNLKSLVQQNSKHKFSRETFSRKNCQEHRKFQLEAIKNII